MSSERDERTPYPIDYERYAAAPKVKQERRKERSSKMIDPEDPTTWPRKLETKRERLMYMFDILGGSNLHGSYKQVWVDDFFDGADSKRVKLSRDILEDIADLNAIWKSGGFRHIPLPVAEALMLRFATTDSKKTILVRTDIIPKRMGTPQHKRCVRPLNNKAYDE